MINLTVKIVVHTIVEIRGAFQSWLKGDLYEVQNFQNTLIFERLHSYRIPVKCTQLVTVPLYARCVASSVGLPS